MDPQNMYILGVCGVVVAGMKLPMKQQINILRFLLFLGAEFESYISWCHM